MPPEFRLVRPLAGGGGNASVDLVELDGRFLVLKRHGRRDVAAERLFHQQLGARGLARLAVEDHPALGPDQILLEYVEGSPTIGGAAAVDVCERWGRAIGGLHAVGSDRFEVLDESGAIVRSSWRDFVGALIDEALDRQRRNATDLPQRLIDQARERLVALLEFEPESFVLSHGDLHLNNALLRDGEVVLFDKSAEVWVAPPVFDLSLIHSEAFIVGRYGAVRDGDAERLSAFLAGYGDLPPGQMDWLDHFVLLRSLRRYPSPFVPQMRTVIEVSLDRLPRP
jgi:Ser/Thr protein kinase RdoA (MazF antagonist)